MHRNSSSWWGALATGVALIAGHTATGQEAPPPAAVERAHQLFNGTWEIVSLTENGETLGAELVRERLVLNGRVRFADRSLIVTAPKTGEARATPFRLNPAALPRQIDFTNRNDQTLEGIYQFEGDDLTICVAEQPGATRPIDFTALSGSGNLLARLRLVPSAATAPAPTAAPAPASAPIRSAATSPKSVEVPPALTATAAVAPRKPTAAELKTAHDLLAGDWTILSIIDDGETLGPDLIRQRIAENGRVRFTANTVAVFNPTEDRTRTMTFRVNPAASPSQIDATLFDSVLRGIYAFDGDTLEVCLAKHEDSPRPTDFTASAGSDRRLFRLKLAPKPVVHTAPPVSAAEIERQRENEIRGLIAGRWVLIDANGQLNLNFRPDGTFIAQRSWSRQARGLLGPKSDTSEGRWMFQNSRLSAQVTTTTDRNVAGTLFGAHIVSIGLERMVTTDGLGISRTLVKAP